jgi:hypothetical protein
MRGMSSVANLPTPKKNPPMDTRRKFPDFPSGVFPDRARDMPSTWLDKLLKYSSIKDD